VNTKEHLDVAISALKGFEYLQMWKASVGGVGEKGLLVDYFGMFIFSNC
jgi:hypothetical protein